MLKNFGLGMDDMALAIIIWPCTLPLAGLLVVPFSELKVGPFAAVGAFAPGKYSNREVLNQ